MKPDWSSIRQAIARKFPNVPSLTTDELANWLATAGRKAPLLFDVRQPNEYAVSHLQGAVRVDQADDIRLVINKFLSADRSPTIPVTVVLYCSVGYRSAQMADRLLAGLKSEPTIMRQVKVYNLDGSIFQWANEGRPVYQQASENNPPTSDSDRQHPAGEVQVRQVHPFNKRWGVLLDPNLN